MELVIDNCENVAAWRTSSGDIVLAENGFREHVLVGNKSIRITIRNAKNQYFERVYDTPIDVTGCDCLRFFMSKYHTTGNGKTVVSNFILKVAIGDTIAGVFTQKNEWYVPIVARATMKTVNIALQGITSFNTIRFSAISDYSDVFWLDYIIACTDEFVIDTVLAFKRELDEQLKFNLGKLAKQYPAGTKRLSLPSTDNVTKYSVILIEEGSVQERHQVAGDVSLGIVEFTQEFDGSALINSFSQDANVYLVVPAVIASKDAMVAVPSINISGIVPVIPDGREAGVIFDSYQVSDGQVRRLERGRDIELPVVLEVRAIQPEMMVVINNFIQHRFSDDGRLLVNGVYCDVDQEAEPDYDVGNIEDEIPYTEHKFRVAVIDSLATCATLVKIPDYELHINI